MHNWKSLLIILGVLGLLTAVLGSLAGPAVASPLPGITPTFTPEPTTPPPPPPERQEKPTPTPTSTPVALLPEGGSTDPDAGAAAGAGIALAGLALLAIGFIGTAIRRRHSV